MNGYASLLVDFLKDLREKMRESDPALGVKDEEMNAQFIKMAADAEKMAETIGAFSDREMEVVTAALQFGYSRGACDVHANYVLSEKAAKELLGKFRGSN